MSSNKLHGIFYNSQKSLCSIWESGRMCYETLKKSDKFILEYSESHEIIMSYDFIVVNFHPMTNRWMSERHVKAFGKPVFCIITEVGLKEELMPNTPNCFTYYLLIDPSISDNGKILGFPRPLETFDVEHIPLLNENIPVIGSFGFATYNKNWEGIFTATKECFDKAIIRLNIPQATHVPPYIHNRIIADIHNKAHAILDGTNIQLEITHINMSKYELVKFCRQNTINVFLYNRRHSHPTGLTATADQAISSGRPLLVSDDPTFRHIHKYMPSYPTINLKQAIEKHGPIVQQMQKDWSSEVFVSKFESLLKL